MIESIAKVVKCENLTEEEAASAFEVIMRGDATPSQIAGFVVALRMKGETAEEITGFARKARAMATPIQVTGALLDTCGTGGDGLATFNISTLAAIVAAAAGARVAKHGNRAASSLCGSADVLEQLGVKIDLAPEGVARCIEGAGIGFLFAPVFHPSFRFAAVTRRELGLRTRGWRGPAEAADAELRLAAVIERVDEAKRNARELWLVALFRARAEGAVDGALNAAEGFARLGDRDAAVLALRIADKLAARSGAEADRAHVRLVAERLALPAAAPASAPSGS